MPSSTVPADVLARADQDMDPLRWRYHGMSWARSTYVLIPCLPPALGRIEDAIEHVGLETTRVWGWGRGAWTLPGELAPGRTVTVGGCWV